MPRSFLVKKKTEKSKKVASNAAVSSLGNGYVSDLREDSLQDVLPLLHSQQQAEFSKPFTHKVVTTKIWKPETQFNADKVNSSTQDTSVDLNNNYSVSDELKDLTQDTENKHKCARCSRTYSTASGLAKHRQFHCANPYVKKTFNCKFCEKVYFSLGALKMHIRTHTLPCKCKICGKAFSRPWLLQGHIRTHTGEKPYVCSQCNRAFADRSNLRAHSQTHSAVKKYSCGHCSKTFSRMSLLIKHEDAGCPSLA